MVDQDQEKPAEPVSVVIVAPYQATHDGTVYGPGEAATVPANVAGPWVLNGWATVGKVVEAKQ